MSEPFWMQVTENLTQTVLSKKKLLAHVTENSQDGIASACLDSRAPSSFELWSHVPHISAFLSSVAAFSGGPSLPLARGQLAAQLQAHSSSEKSQGGISLDQLGSHSLFRTSHGGQGERSMLIGQALITLSPGGEGQGQIHQPELHELALKGGDDSLRKNHHCYQKNGTECWTNENWGTIPSSQPHEWMFSRLEM